MQPQNSSSTPLRKIRRPRAAPAGTASLAPLPRQDIALSCDCPSFSDLESSPLASQGRGSTDRREHGSLVSASTGLDADPLLVPSMPVPHARKLRPRSLTALTNSPGSDLVVYSVGKAFESSELQDLEERVSCFHRNPEMHNRCRMISAAAEHFLALVHTAVTGWGYTAKREIPAGTEVCYYSGVIRMKTHASASTVALT